jgi:hypothetical protein
MTTALSLHAASIEAEAFEQAQDPRGRNRQQRLPRAVKQDDGLTLYGASVG